MTEGPAPWPGVAEEAVVTAAEEPADEDKDEDVAGVAAIAKPGRGVAEEAVVASAAEEPAEYEEDDVAAAAANAPPTTAGVEGVMATPAGRGGLPPAALLATGGGPAGGTSCAPDGRWYGTAAG